MTYLLLQTFLLLLASYFAGAFVACTAKRLLFAGAVERAPVFVPADVDGVVQPPVMMPPQPVRPRTPLQPVTPRAIDPVQPKIEVLRRPEPRPHPQVLDPSRFERALMGPDPNEGVPRIAVAEIRPAVLPPVTDIYVPKLPEPEPEAEPPPLPPEPEPEPEAEPEPAAVFEPVDETVQPREWVDENAGADRSVSSSDVEQEIEPAEVVTRRRGGLAARLRDATTSAAAGAVAAAKAAAAASVFTSPSSERTAKTDEVAREPAEHPPVVEDEPDVPPAPEEVQGVQDEPVTEVAIAEADAEAAHAAQDTAHDFEDLETPAEQQAHDPIEPSEEKFEEPPASEPASVPEPVIAPAAEPQAPIEEGDDFQRIRAIDAEIEQKLKVRGVRYFEHIAAWSAADVKQIAQQLDIPGRIDREQWVEQAQILAKGGETYYSRNRKAKLDAGGSSNRPAPATTVATAKGVDSADTDATTAQARAQSGTTGVAAANHGRSVAEMAAAAAAAIAASSASVTRGRKPIEPISPLSKVDPKLSLPARITDAIREKEDAQPPQEEAAIDQPAPVSTPTGAEDDLKRIRGIGVLIEKRLNGLGIARYEQIANWTSGDIDRVSRVLGFKGRIERESWVEQARILSSGGQTEFSRRVDRGEVDTTRDA
jgi:predicted flap endonuclease-1-like 5' DNA nuclease